MSRKDPDEHASEWVHCMDCGLGMPILCMSQPTTARTPYTSQVTLTCPTRPYSYRSHLIQNTVETRRSMKRKTKDECRRHFSDEAPACLSIGNQHAPVAEQGQQASGTLPKSKLQASASNS